MAAFADEARSLGRDARFDQIEDPDVPDRNFGSGQLRGHCTVAGMGGRKAGSGSLTDAGVGSDAPEASQRNTDIR
jgi:hypothetical protein